MDSTTDPSVGDFFVPLAAVGTAAAVSGVVAYVMMRRSGTPLRPRWQPPGVRWRASALLLTLFPVALLGSQIAIGTVAGAISPLLPTPGQDEASLARRQWQLGLWASVLATPAVFLAYLAVRRAVLAGSRFAVSPGAGVLARNIVLGVVGWTVLTPLTFAVYFGVQKAFPVTDDKHPLMAHPPQADGAGGLLFLVGVCAATPFREEAVFRGLLVPWAGQRRFAPWVLMLAAFLMAGLTAARPMMPVGFVAALCLPLLLLQTVAPPKRFPRRTLAAILASSAVFAAMHSAVWPTPVPLFVLGCGLGYLTSRTGSVVPGIVAHGLFNAVSSAMLYRAAAG